MGQSFTSSKTQLLDCGKRPSKARVAERGKPNAERGKQAAGKRAKNDTSR